jgi:hypothetical protein
VGRARAHLNGGLNYEGGRSQPLVESESEVMRKVMDYLRQRDIYFQRTNSGKVQKGKHWIKLCDEGTPDLLACYRGVFLGIETKTLVGKVSDEQARQHNLIERSGGYVIVPRSLDDLYAALEEIDTRLGMGIFGVFRLIMRSLNDRLTARAGVMLFA